MDDDDEQNRDYPPRDNREKVKLQDPWEALLSLEDHHDTRDSSNIHVPDGGCNFDGWCPALPLSLRSPCSMYARTSCQRDAQTVLAHTPLSPSTLGQIFTADCTADIVGHGSAIRPAPAVHVAIVHDRDQIRCSRLYDGRIRVHLDLGASGRGFGDHSCRCGKYPPRPALNTSRQYAEFDRLLRFSEIVISSHGLLFHQVNCRGRTQWNGLEILLSSSSSSKFGETLCQGSPQRRIATVR